MTRVTFADMLDDAALLSLEHQLYLADVLGDHQWSANLEEPRFELTGDHPLVCSVVHLLGTAAPGPGSWLWSWANPAGYSHGVIGLAAALAEFGQNHAIAELTSPEVPFTALPGSPTQPFQAVAPMIDAAKVFSGRWFAYNGDAGGGTRAAFLLEHPELVLPAADPARVMRVIQQSVAELNLHDHRRAIHSYALRRPLEARFTADHTTLTLTGAQLRITVAFDHLGRLAHLDGTLG